MYSLVYLSVMYCRLTMLVREVDIFNTCIVNKIAK